MPFHDIDGWAKSRDVNVFSILFFTGIPSWKWNPKSQTAKRRGPATYNFWLFTSLHFTILPFSLPCTLLFPSVFAVSASTPIPAWVDVERFENAQSASKHSLEGLIDFIPWCFLPSLTLLPTWSAPFTVGLRLVCLERELKKTKGGGQGRSVIIFFRPFFLAPNFFAFRLVFMFHLNFLLLITSFRPC